ncbi:MAG: hypothetical protein V3T30_01005 [Thermodesulfobacteriota bacterium]
MHKVGCARFYFLALSAALSGKRYRGKMDHNFLETINRQPTMKAYVDVHRGERFLVCGMGTSIDQYPVGFYENWPGITIGVNEITGLFKPDYHLNINERNNSIKKKKYDHLISFKYMSPSSMVEIKKTGRLSMRGTGALPAFTAAYQMGASEIYLIGIDFKPGPDGRIYYRECPKKQPRYYQLSDGESPELQATLRAFDDAFKKYKDAGVKIYNLSMNSLLSGIYIIRPEKMQVMMERQRCLG